MKFGVDAPSTKVEWYKDGDVHVKEVKSCDSNCMLVGFANMIL